MNDCASQEVWKAGDTDYAIALKLCDEGKHRDDKHRWFYSWVSSGCHQLWEGGKGSGAFTASGCVTASPSAWTPISVDIQERIVEESNDGGKTWLPHAKEQ